MDPISNVDRLVLILRQRLEERARAATRKPSGARTARPTVTLDSARALAAVDGVDARLLGRTVIQNVLAQQLGPSLLNDAGFQRIVDQVADALQADPEASNLLAHVVSDLRAAVR